MDSPSGKVQRSVQRSVPVLLSKRMDGNAPATEISVVSANSEQELKTAAEETPAGKAGNGVYKTGRKVEINSYFSCVLRKSNAVYALVIAFIWLIHTVPVILFFSINATFSPQHLAINSTKTGNVYTYSFK
jgi:hypothetical protein